MGIDERPPSWAPEFSKHDAAGFLACPACGYPLEGLGDAEACPECGCSITKAALALAAAKAHRARRLATFLFLASPLAVVPCVRLMMAGADILGLLVYLGASFACTFLYLRRVHGPDWNLPTLLILTPFVALLYHMIFCAVIFAAGVLAMMLFAIAGS